MIYLTHLSDIAGRSYHHMKEVTQGGWKNSPKLYLDEFPQALEVVHCINSQS